MKRIIKILLIGLTFAYLNQAQCGLPIGHHAFRAAGSTSIGKVVLAAMSGAASVAAGLGSILFLAAACNNQQNISKQNNIIKLFNPIKVSIDAVTEENLDATIPAIDKALCKFEKNKEYAAYPNGFWFGQMQDKLQRVLSLHKTSSQETKALAEPVRLFKESAHTFVAQQNTENNNLYASRNDYLKASSLLALISSVLGFYSYVKAKS